MSGAISATTLVYIAAAAAVVGAAASVYQGAQAQNAADANAELQRREGEQQKDAAMAQADKIRKAARAQAGAANAALAASGVSVGDGTAVRINEQIYQDSEQDAYNTLLTGSRAQRTANNQANVITAQGNSAMISGALNAGSSLLAGGANYAKWKTTK
jgi:hypothetical protein